MNKKNSFIFLILVTTTLNVLFNNTSTSSKSLLDFENEVIFSIPLGFNGVHYSGNGNPEILPGGPEAITIAPDNTFWIADTADNCLLQYSLKGKLLSKIYVGDIVKGIFDLEVSSGEISVLDIASKPPKIVQFSLDGEVISSFDLPKGFHRGDGTTGLALASDGSILIEREGGISLTRFISPNGEKDLTMVYGYEFSGKVYTAQPANLMATESSKGLIIVDDRQIALEVSHNLGSIRILGVISGGTFFVEVQEVVINKVIQVDQKVYRYNSFGKLTGMARVPLIDQFIPVSHSIAIGPDGNVYALITKPNGAEVRKLTFVASLPHILDSSESNDTRHDLIERSLTANCRSRSDMIQVAVSYFENSTYLNSYHINDPYGECPSRTKPPNLNSAGWYPSVPYAWGVADTVVQFNNFMSGGENHFFAGDYTDPNSGCGRGVDCSGLVSMAWDLGFHYGTCSLEDPEVSTSLGTFQEMQKGDIVNKCSTTPRHVVLFDKFGFNGQGQGMYGYEATITTNVYRVDYTFRLFSDLSSYTPRTYVEACNKIHFPILKDTHIEMDIEDRSINPYPLPYPYP
jgi:hypothetical protein